MRYKIVLVFCFFLKVFAAVSSSETDLKIIEQFLSAMTTLEADMEMSISENNNLIGHFHGKIWLDRQKAFLRINYGKHKMISKKGMLFIYQDMQEVQKFDATDTPAGILLKPTITFKGEKIVVKDFIKDAACWKLSLTYDSPVGQIPVELYFAPPPVIVLSGWKIQNIDGSVTEVRLNPEEIHMSIPIDPSIFEVD